MPKTTLSPGATTYHSGTFRHLYVLPDIYHDPYWISRWKFDDISTGYALDSKHTNNLRASGNPTQVAGYRQTYATEFDGIDDCFYLPWASGSGLQGLLIPQSEQSASLTTPNFGIMCSLFVKDFSKDQFIASKWNDNGTDIDWAIGINPSGGVFFSWKPDATFNARYANSSKSGIIPSGQWCDFSFIVNGCHNTDTSFGASMVIIVNDVIVAECYGSNFDIEETGTSGVFVIGAADYGRRPSGFFGGIIEDFRFYNGKHPSLPNYNAFHSGVSPLTSYPSLTENNPYIGAHFKFNSMPSGNDLYPGFTGTQYKGFYLEDRANSQILISSGTQWRTTGFNLVDGAAAGTKGSGLKMLAASNARFSREVGKTKLDTLFPRHSFTISWWQNSLQATTTSQSYIGTPTTTLPGPFRIYMDTTTRIGVGVSLEEGAGGARSIAINNQTTMSSGIWTHHAIVVNLEQSKAEIYQSGIWRTTRPISSSGIWLKEAPQYFYLGQVDSNIAENGYSGMLDEMVIFHYPLPSSQITEFYTLQSGFVLPTYSQSGTIATYTSGNIWTQISGQLGFYASGDYNNSRNYIGAYQSGVQNYFVSGMLGGFTDDNDLVGSGFLGIYASGAPNRTSGMIGGLVDVSVGAESTVGGYILMAGASSGSLGAFTRAGEAVQQDAQFTAFFNIIGRDRKEFDAQVQIYKSRHSEFDAQAVVYTKELQPNVLIFKPATNQSGTTVPVTYTFEATASGTQGKSIYRTFWFFSDDTSTSGSVTTSSGTFKADHTFAKSGIFDVIFVAVDTNGIINSDRRKVSTVSGMSTPVVTLNATPIDGITPLQVAFSGVVTSATSPIVDKYIYFGDGTRSASTDSIYKMYPVIGSYIPVFRVRDSSGIIVTDSIVVGGNS